ncbi:hypothetical protein P8936_12305 [Edaphobacter paludis]|uniref:Uncharacterized protein n=1 Tax=Edaphobacter paludis TaxID=3035702 RepID=A0AAU7D4W2_9BACT
MSILIEQTQAEMQCSYAFSRRAEIVGVKVISASFAAPRVLSVDSEESLSVGIRFAPKEAPIVNGCVQANTFFECVITEAAMSEGLDPLAKFECSLMATYQLHEGYMPTEAEIAAFHKANVIFNCWPYFREFIQNSAARMNIPPPPVPFIRVHVISDNPAGALPQPLKRPKKSTKSISMSAGAKLGHSAPRERRSAAE